LLASQVDSHAITEQRVVQLGLNGAITPRMSNTILPWTVLAGLMSLKNTLFLLPLMKMSAAKRAAHGALAVGARGLHDRLPGSPAR
jgi:hypothetical protein